MRDTARRTDGSAVWDAAFVLPPPAALDVVPPDVLPAIAIELAGLIAAVGARLQCAGAAQACPAAMDRAHDGDRDEVLLTTPEAAARLRVSPKWLYRHRWQLPFVVRLSRRELRWSPSKLERYLQQRGTR